MYRFFLIILFSSLNLSAKENSPPALASLRSANGNKVIRATPIEIKGDLIVFKRGHGANFTSAIDKFSPEDQVKLKAWMVAMKEDPHLKLVNRVRTTGHLKVLFIGNSYSFNVPKAFEKIAKSKQKNITVEQVTSGGCTLAKHSKSQKLLEKIKTGKYDIIILQEQSQLPSVPEQQRSSQMDHAARKLVTHIKDSGAIPVFFQTWGRKNGDKQNRATFPDDTFHKMQARLVNGYANVAEACGGDIHIVPVGELWKKRIQQDAGQADKLFSNDGSHPAKDGVSYTAAAFFSALYDEPLDTKGENISDGARLQTVPYQ